MENFVTVIQQCNKCLILEDRSVSIVIGDDGVCNLCKMDPSKYKQMLWEEKAQAFNDLVQEKKGKYQFDGIIMMSGGKDSTYMALKLVREYKLNLLGMSIDNGFEYPDSFDNAKKVCEQLGIPYIIMQPNLIKLREFYRYIATDKQLRRNDYAQVCFYCANYLKRQADIYAEKFNTAYIFTGYNPDQVAVLGEADIVESDPGLILYQQMIKKGIDEELKKTYQYTLKKYGSEMATYFEPPKTKRLYYHQHFPYEPINMIETVKKELNWEPIKRFKKNYIISGCQLVCTLVQLCRRKGIPDYLQKEFSTQIRRGTLNKEEVKKFMNVMKFTEEEMEETLAKLNLTCEQMLSF